MLGGFNKTWLGFLILSTIFTVLPINTSLQLLSQTSSSLYTEQQRIMELKRYHLEMLKARGKRDKLKELYEQGLESKANYEEVEVEYRKAQVEYQRSFLSLFSEVPRVTVISAVKSQTSDGRKEVRLIIKNISAPNLDYQQLGLVDPEVPLPDELRLRELANIIISLKNEKNTIISDPYEAMVASLKVGETKTIDFGLLDDIDTALVAMNYAGKNDDRPVYLQKDANANIVSVQSSQFSQEADLGSSVIYGLRLERFTKATNVFKFQVVNLTKQISYDFLESRDGNSRLAQYRFAEGETTKNLFLRLYLPEIANQKDLAETNIVMDKPLIFYVLVLDQALADKYPVDRNYGEDEIAKIPAGKVKLELIPRGVGKIEVSLNNYYQEIRVGENIELSTTIKNVGTRRVDNIKINAELPFNWASKVEPDIIRSLDVNKEVTVNITVKPPADVGVGDYQVKIKTDAYANQRKVQSEDREDRVHIVARANVWLTAGLIGGLLTLVLGIVIFGVKITRR